MSPKKEKLVSVLHLFDLSENIQKRIYCYLDEDFRKDFFRKFRNHYGTIVNASRNLKISEDKVRGWVLGKNIRKIRNRIVPIQAYFLFQIAKELKMNSEDVEKKIISIKTKSSSSHLLKKPYLPIPLNYELGRLLGISLGDGHLTKNSTVVYANNSDKLIEETRNCVNFLGDITLKIGYSNGLKYLIIPSVIGFILKELGTVDGNKVAQKENVRFIKNINSLPDEFKLGVISGLLDDEGSVIRDGKYGKIYFEQHIPHIVKGIQKLINSFGIRTSEVFTDRKRSRFYFYIYRRSELKKVLNMNLFKHPDKAEKLTRIVTGDLIGK